MQIKKFLLQFDEMWSKVFEYSWALPVRPWPRRSITLSHFRCIIRAFCFVLVLKGISWDVYKSSFKRRAKKVFKKLRWLLTEHCNGGHYFKNQMCLKASMCDEERPAKEIIIVFVKKVLPSMVVHAPIKKFLNRPKICSNSDSFLVTKTFVGKRRKACIKRFRN